MKKEVTEEKVDKKKCTKKEELEAVIAEKDATIKILEDKVLREKAEMINYRNRKDEELTRMLKYANESIAKNLLPVLDNFERALVMEHDNHDKEVTEFMKGFIMIYENLKSTLEKYEVTEIKCLGENFDPALHHAVMSEKAEDKEAGIVIEVLQKGYMIKDRVLRAAMVKVSE